MSPNDSSALIGRTIAGKFIVEAVIAAGGSGTVYRARQLALERTVALKVLRDEVARDRDFIERFKREARAASRLDHPNSVRVLDFGQHGDSLLYLAMEYVEGRTLFQIIQEEWPLAHKRIVDILSQVLAALGVAHDMEVIHRDLKPENIMIIRGRSDEGEHAELAKVCDFGIATLGALTPTGESTLVLGPRVTSREFLVGTPEYMSPEQARGEALDRRSDIYAVGVVLYQMLVGHVPFHGGTPLAVAVRHITEAPAPPSTQASVDPRLEAICMKALSKAPQDRYASAREMRAALRATLAPTSEAGAPLAAPTPEPFEAGAGGFLAPITLKVRRRRPLLVGALAVVAVAAGLTARSALRARPPSVASQPAWPAPPSTPVAAAEPPAPPPPSPAPTPEPAPAFEPPSEPAPTFVPPPAGEWDSLGAHRGKAAVGKDKAGRPGHGRPGSDRHSDRPGGAAEGEAPGPEAALVPAAGPPPAVPVPARPLPAATAVVPSPVIGKGGVDIGRATVSVTGVATASGIPGSNIRAAVSRIPILGCYRDGLRVLGAPAPGTATLRLHIDVAGYVTDATLQDSGFAPGRFPPGMKGCIEQAARAVRVKDVDTGEATADVTLTFVSGP